jgi:hypothetical protein
MFRDGFSPLRATTAPARFIALAVTAALIVTVAEPLPAAARSAQFTRPVVTGTATDFSAARRRGHVRRHYGRRGGGPGLAMMGMMIGAIGTIANAERRRAYYDDAPVVYAPQPYYGQQPYAQPYYGGGYYGGGYDPGYAYAPQPAYPVAPVYAAPIARGYRAGPAFVPHVHAAPQFNFAHAAPRFIPQGPRRHH